MGLMVGFWLGLCTKNVGFPKLRLWVQKDKVSKVGFGYHFSGLGVVFEYKKVVFSGTRLHHFTISISVDEMKKRHKKHKK